MPKSDMFQVREEEACFNPLPDQGADREYWHWTDLNIGAELLLYGRRVTLTSCDEFSRAHLASEGVELAPMEPPSIDPYEVAREVAGPEGQRQEHSTKDTYDSLQQFLHHDRKVLRYFAYSQTPFTPLGKTYKKKFVICFFLSDNSVEVGGDRGGS